MNPHFRQQDFIYDLNWDKKIDNSFIDLLCMDARLGNFVWPMKTMSTLIAAKDTIRRHYDQDFSYVYINKKLDLLEQRYSTFKWILEKDGVNYDPSTNIVTAPVKKWSDITAVITISPLMLFRRRCNCITSIDFVIKFIVNLASDGC